MKNRENIDCSMIKILESKLYETRFLSLDPYDARASWISFPQALPCENSNILQFKPNEALVVIYDSYYFTL